MIKGEMAKNVVRHTSWIITISLIILILMSILPIIKISENEAVDSDLYFNLEMMKKSINNTFILNLANELDFIILLLIIIIIINLLSTLGAIIHASGYVHPIADILIVLGCFNLFFSVIIYIKQWSFIKNVQSLGTISLANIFTSFGYVYLIFIIDIFLILVSVLYLYSFIKHGYFRYKEAKNKKLKEKNIVKKDIKKIEIEKPIIAKKVEEKKQYPIITKTMPVANTKKQEVEKWLEDEIKVIEKQKDIQQEKIEPQKKPFKKETPSLFSDEFNTKNNKEEIVDIKNESEPFHKEKEEIINTNELEEVSSPSSFDKALSSAIQKKQTEMKQPQQDIDDEKPIDINEDLEKSIPISEENISKKLNVRCPLCTQIFSIDKKEGLTKIKCPHCGKEGVIK